jgi:phenylacetate-CoA ligase
MWAALVRKLFYPTHEALMGRRTLAVLHDLTRTAALSEEEMAEYQAQQSRVLGEHACAASPYWRARLDECAPTSHHRALAPAPLALFTAHAPILTRAEIRRHREGMRCPTDRGKLIHHSSSGTTDDNLVFYLNRERQAWDRAARIHALSRLGVALGEKQLHFMPQFGAGGPWEPVKNVARRTRDRLTSDPAFDLRPHSFERLDAALAFLRSYRPAVIVGYPSWLFGLAQHALRTKTDIVTPGLRYVLSTGELLYAFQRKRIESVFGVRVVEEYGSQEVGVIASEDESGQWIVNRANVVVEVLRNGRAGHPGEMGEVIVTSLHSTAMPFVRYATGDVANVSRDTGCLTAGLRTLPPIEGRTSDLLVTTDGRVQSNRELVDTLVREIGSVEFSLHQTAPDRLLCMTIRNGGWVGKEEKVTDVLRSILGRSLQVEWKVGAAFQLLKSGKRRYICSPVAQSVLAHDRESGMFLSRAWPQRVLGAA